MILFVNTQIISKFIKGTCFLLSVIDIFSKYPWVFPLKNKKGITITNVFLKKSLMNLIRNQKKKKNERKWVDDGSGF